MNGYYSVFNPRGEKIADCGIERDAVTLIGMRNQRWDGHYYQFNPLPGEIIDSVIEKELVGQQGLPPVTITIGGQEIPIQQSLPESDSERFGFH